MKGASNTLTTIPVKEHGFYFECKSDFHDHVHLRYGWPVDRLPSSCPCGARYSIQHSQICKLAGFISMRHDDITDFLAKCLKQVHNDVEVEPPLLPLTGETFRHRSANTESDARADIRVRGFWTDSQMHFLTRGCFIPTRQAIGTGISHHSSSHSRVPRSGNIQSELLRLSMAHSHHWYSRHAVEWVLRPLW